MILSNKISFLMNYTIKNLKYLMILFSYCKLWMLNIDFTWIKFIVTKYI